MCEGCQFEEIALFKWTTADIVGIHNVFGLCIDVLDACRESIVSCAVVLGLSSLHVPDLLTFLIG